MRLAALVAVGSIGVACASSRTSVAPTTFAPPPPALASQQRTQEFHFTEQPIEPPPYQLPPAFAQLTPRDRERWHACHIFFMGRHVVNNVTFRVTPSEYVETPGAARREFLVSHGCPDGIVDLADGTHLDIIEH